MRCDIVATLVIDYRQGRTQNAEVHHPPPRGNLSRQGDLRANMRCSQCGFDNPDGMKFCGQCTAALALVCPNCRFENPPGFKFCGQCTTPLVPGSPVPRLSKSSISVREINSAEALDGERKTVTALFADIKGRWSLWRTWIPKKPARLSIPHSS
jgi:hypothetical protein